MEQTLFNNTFVSSFVDLNLFEDRPSEKSLKFYLDKGIRLLKSKKTFPFVIFVDERSKKIFEEELDIHSFNPNIFFVLSSPDDFCVSKLFPDEVQRSDVYVPVTNNPKKDTYNYMALMINKTEYVKRAIELNPFKSERFTWIDLGILHIIKDDEVECFEDTLEYIEKYDDLFQDSERIEKIRIPGCYLPTEKIRSSSIKEFCEFPCWVFCGGFFSGKKNSILKFDEEVKKCFDFLKQDNFITWELNIWAYIFCRNENLFDYYFGDHNIKMIKNFRVNI